MDIEKDVPIKGVQKTSLVDYPGKVCAVVFLPNCNFRCGYCQNPELITEPDKFPNVTETELFGLFKDRGKWLDAVCISGGEPTLHIGLSGLIRKIKSGGLLVKLDTNGTNPRMLKAIIDEKTVDYIAMDIKGPIEKYAEIVNSPVDLRKIEESIDIIRNSGIDYEFRTTVLPKLITEQDVLKIGQWLKGSKHYALQQFHSHKTLDPNFSNEESYPPEDLERFKKLLEPYFDEVEVRGI